VEIRLADDLEEKFIGSWDSLVCDELDAPDDPSQPSAWFVIPRDAYLRYHSDPDADGVQGSAPSHTDGAAPGYSGLPAPTIRPFRETQVRTPPCLAHGREQVLLWAGLLERIQY
jgi:hypothetical protein